jgi:hypothetical protein
MRSGCWRRVRGMLTSPVPYGAWLLLVLISLPASYFSHPYIFAFTTLILAWISGAIALTGFAVALLSKTASWRVKAWIFVAIALTVASVVVAFAVLRTINWA